MILASIGPIMVIWERGKAEIVGATDAEEARIRKALGRPARVQVAVAVEEGGIEERLVRMAPGTAAHARAVFRGMTGARILHDSED